MAQIAEYIVMEPPTSAEVYARAVAEIGNGIMHLVLKPSFEVPREDTREISFNMINLNRRHDYINGDFNSEEYPSYHSIRVDFDMTTPDAPAVATILID